MFIGVAPSFGYPSEDQAKAYCYAFRLAVSSATGLLFLMHLITIACVYLIFNNNSRGSFVHERLDFETAALEYALSRNNSIVSRQGSTTGGVFNGGGMLSNPVKAVDNPIAPGPYMPPSFSQETKK
jgi:hypothetical protein